MVFNVVPKSAWKLLGHHLFVWAAMIFPLSLANAQPPANAQPATDSADVVLWYGTLDAKTRIFRFVLELRQVDEKWTGTLLSLDEGQARFPLDGLVLNEKRLSFEIKASAAKFESELTANNKTENGKWNQAATSFDLNFERVDEIPSEKVKALWTGKLNAVIQKLEVAFQELESGQILFESVSQRAGGFVASKTMTDDEVVFEVAALKAKFTGRINPEGTEIVGVWRQAIVPMNLTLTKSESKVVDAVPLKRPQNPKAPFPYQIEEVVVDNPNHEGVKLAGTLTLPNGVKRPPAVILISGSGPQDRDETIVDHKPFWVIADHLSRRGVAVLRFDDRGVGQSKGNHANATSADFASDVQALVKFLQAQDRIDPKRVGLCGHSEGGMIASMVAASDPSVAFVIMLAGTGVNGEQILINQSRLILKASGVAEDEIERQGAMQRIMIDLVKEFPNSSVEQLKQKATAAIDPYLTDVERKSEQAIASVTQATTQLSTPWFRFFLTYEPTIHLKRLTCPTLVLNGAKDVQVDPKLNLPAIEAALNEAKLAKFEIVEFPGLNHLFQNCATGNVSEYAEIEETIDLKVLEKIASWILSLPAK